MMHQTQRLYRWTLTSIATLVLLLGNSTGCVSLKSLQYQLGCGSTKGMKDLGYTGDAYHSPHCGQMIPDGHFLKCAGCLNETIYRDAMMLENVEPLQEAPMPPQMVEPLNEQPPMAEPPVQQPRIEEPAEPGGFDPVEDPEQAPTVPRIDVSIPDLPADIAMTGEPEELTVQQHPYPFDFEEVPQFESADSSTTGALTVVQEHAEVVAKSQVENPVQDSGSDSFNAREQKFLPNPADVVEVFETVNRLPIPSTKTDLAADFSDEGYELDNDEGDKLDNDEGYELDIDEGYELDIDEGYELDIDEGYELETDEGYELDSTDDNSPGPSIYRSGNDDVAIEVSAPTSILRKTPALIEVTNAGSDSAADPNPTAGADTTGNVDTSANNWLRPGYPKATTETGLSPFERQGPIPVRKVRSGAELIFPPEAVDSTESPTTDDQADGNSVLEKASAAHVPATECITPLPAAEPQQNARNHPYPVRRIELSDLPAKILR